MEFGDMSASKEALNVAPNDKKTSAGQPASDDISNLTEDHQSTVSRTSTISRFTGEVASILSTSLQILRGEAPGIIAEESQEMEIPRQVMGSFETAEQTEETFKDEHRRIDDETGQNDEYIDFLQDPVIEMTWGRRIALYCMKRYTWYNPRLNQDEIEEEEESEVFKELPRETYQAYPFDVSRRENPSLERAWAYFEHVALSRYVVPKQEGKSRKNILVRMVRRLFCKGEEQLERAEPGEKEFKTRLYKPIFTPHKQLGDFGLGIGLYFSTLRAITVLTFLAGLINLPNIIYFALGDYNGDMDQTSMVQSFPVIGSAVCVDVSWVPCSECANITNKVTGTGENGMEITFGRRNNCNGAIYQVAMINYATIVFVIVGIMILNRYLNQMEIAFDEDEQTAQDYSIVVENPPGDATNPDEWFNFFRDSFDGAHMTACTVAVDNDLLVRCLVERREILRRIEMMVPPGTSLDTLNLTRLSAKEHRARKTLDRWKALISPGIPELFGRVVVLNAMVQGLAQQEYPATKVFCTFETEAAQRRILKALSYGAFNVSRQKVRVVKEKTHLFRGKHLLGVSEPDEPNTVRWQDLNQKLKTRLKQQGLTIFATLCSILAIAFAIRVTSDTSVEFAAIAISVFNSVFPMFAKALTDMEAHSSEGGKQRSLYFKIALFRWVNTAVVITIITPFTETIEDGGLIQQIYALFFAEIVTTNAIQLADPVGHVRRHYFAPRATTQDAMNNNMQGQVFELAERYTNMTKILFLALWYSAIYPGALFLCALALLINYFTDRFSLMRTWKRAPQLGTKISQFSRRYFFSLAIVAMAMMSSYYWSAFPFDNLCIDENNVNDYGGTWRLVDGNGEVVKNELVVDNDATVYKQCLQDFFRYDRDERSFPFLPRFQRENEEWMTEDQELVTKIFGWSCLGVVALVMISFILGWLSHVQTYFNGGFDARGEDQNIPFSEVASRSSYIPQVESSVFSYPLLACSVDAIDHELLEWTDPDRPDYVFYDLTRDAEVLLRGTDVSSKVVFSHVSHYPPPVRSK